MSETEAKVLELKPSFFAFADGILLAGMCIISGIILAALTGTYAGLYGIIIAMATEMFGVLVIGVVYFRSLAYNFRVDKLNVSAEYNFVVFKSETIPVETVTEVLISQSLWERLFKIASVRVYSLVGGKRCILFFGVSRPDEVRKTIFDNREARLQQIKKV